MSKRKKKKQSVPTAPAAVSVPVAAPAVVPNPRSRWLMVGLLIAAAVVRLLFLGRAELWQDELGWIRIAMTTSNPFEIFRASWDFILSIGQMPLGFMFFNVVYHVMEWIGIEVNLSTPFAARIPAVLWGVPAVYGVFLLARRIADEAVAWGAALMMAFFFFPVYYSREAYVYAQIICLAPFAAYLLIRIVFDGRRGIGIMLGFVACLLGLLYAHMGALMIVVAMAAPVFVWWCWLLVRKQQIEWQRGLFQAGILIAISLLLASPHVLRFLLFNEAHQAGAPFSPWVILNDGVNKLFMGESTVAALLAWIIVLAGAIGLVVPGVRAAERRLVLSMTVLGLVLITVATHRSQYLSVRYFAPVAPLLYPVFAAGFRWLAIQLGKWTHRPEMTRTAYAALISLAVGVHLVLFIPALLKLSYKSVPYGLIADWINEHLDAGTPYVMESAYDIRWVGGGFPTPGRFPVSPYVHLSGPDEVRRLHEAQQDFMERFPVSAFIQSAHHNWNQPVGIWTWPHGFYHRHHRIQATDPLRRLIKLGINPGLPHEEIADVSYRIDIYYNRWQDLVDAARPSDTPFLMNYPGWQIQRQQVSPIQAFYFRMQAGPRGGWELHHVGDVPLDGSVRFEAALFGPEGAGIVPLEFSIAGQTPVQVNVRMGQSFQYTVPFQALMPGVHNVQWRLREPSREPVQFILVNSGVSAVSE